MADNLKISDFVSKFEDGFIHPNLYQVTFSGNNLSKFTKGSEDVKILGLACKTAKIPGVTYTEGKFSVKGKYRKFATGADLDPVEFVFLVDAKGIIIDIFDAWASHIYDMEKGEFGYKDDYTCEIDVAILNRKGEVVYTGIIENAYPTVVTSFDLGYENENQIMEYSITFQYDSIKSK